MWLRQISWQRRLLVGVLLFGTLLSIIYGVNVWLTPAPPPLVAVNVELLLIQAGDLPPDILIRSGPIPAYVQGFGPPAADQQVVRLLETRRPGTGSGSIVVLRYAAQQIRANAYTKLTHVPLILRLLGTPVAPVAGLGEKSQVLGPNSIGGVYVVFQRCDALVHLEYDIAPSYNTSIDMDALFRYAKRLDARLEQALCP